MEDVRAASLADKERLLCIFSTYHTQAQPSWLQFGTGANVFVYLSRLASAAEQGFLKIQSYVINLLIDDINKALKLLDTNGNM
jgi:SpoU rRNA methylase family enzyme